MELILPIIAVIISILSPLFSYITIKNDKKKQDEKREQENEKRNLEKWNFLRSKTIIPTEHVSSCSLSLVKNNIKNISTVLNQYIEILDDVEKCMTMFDKKNNKTYELLRQLRNYCTTYASCPHCLTEYTEKRHQEIQGILNQLKEFYEKESNKYYNRTKREKEKLLTKEETWQWKL